MKITLQINTSKGQSFCCCERGVQLNSAIGEREGEVFSGLLSSAMGT